MPAREPTDIADPMFDRSPPLEGGNGPPDPVVYDGSAAALRQRVVNFAAKCFADMMYVTGLDRTRERHFRWRPIERPGGLTERPAASPDAAFTLLKAQRAGRIAIDTDNTAPAATLAVRRRHRDAAPGSGRRRGKPVRPPDRYPERVDHAALGRTIAAATESL